MKHVIFTGLMLLLSVAAFAQNALSPEEEAKKIRESIDKEVERLTTLLDLADWQVFYVDSTLSYNVPAMRAEQKVLQESKVSNTDLYWRTVDTWQEATFRQYRKIFNDAQWNRFMKSGGAKEQKAREKRAAKAEKAALKVKNEK